MLLIEINANSFLINKNLSVLEACKFLGLIIPRFCYHETLSIAGNCRMCLIELANSPKPIAACALPLLNDMQIFINTPLVKKARENVIETLLINHPLDCPICDQGGECDLQDQTLEFGINNLNRFYFLKRKVRDKNFSYLIKTVMTRCIHCTRCVRFNSEITGMETLGLLNRGKNTEVGNYTQHIFESELSANLIDLCPVGALTSKTYAFKSRPWELKITETIDLTDSLGSNIYVQYKDAHIKRILPKIALSLNENFISDKARFFFDSLTTQRLYKLFSKEASQFKISTNSYLLQDLFNSLQNNQNILIIIDSEMDFKSLLLLNALSFKHKKSVSLCKNFKEFNTSNIKKTNDLSSVRAFKNIKYSLYCLIAINLKIEAAILNGKLRIKAHTETAEIFSLSLFYKTTFAIKFINLSFKNFSLILSGKLPSFSKKLLKTAKIFFFLGEKLFHQGFLLKTFKENTTKYLANASLILVKPYSNSESLTYLNISPLTKHKFLIAKKIFLINLDSTTALYKHILTLRKNKNMEMYWFNTHGSKIAQHAFFIIPLTSTFESDKQLFLNTEEKPQITAKLFSLNHEALIFSNIILLLLKASKNLEMHLFQPFLFLQNKINDSLLLSPISFFYLKKKIFHKNKIFIYPTKPIISDFYLSNKLTKHSNILSKCSRNFQKTIFNF